MAATLSNQKLVANVPYLIETGYYTTLQDGVGVVHTHLGDATVAPTKVEFVITERPTTRDPIWCVWDESANDTTNGTVAFIFDTIPGGDLTGGEVKYTITWIQQVDGGIS